MSDTKRSNELDQNTIRREQKRKQKTRSGGAKQANDGFSMRDLQKEIRAREYKQKEIENHLNSRVDAIVRSADRGETVFLTDASTDYKVMLAVLDYAASNEDKYWTLAGYRGRQIAEVRLYSRAVAKAKFSEATAKFQDEKEYHEHGIDPREPAAEYKLKYMKQQRQVA